jgi:hypothetical protein
MDIGSVRSAASSLPPLTKFAAGMALILALWSCPVRVDT